MRRWRSRQLVQRVCTRHRLCRLWPSGAATWPADTAIFIAPISDGATAFALYPPFSTIAASAIPRAISTPAAGTICSAAAQATATAPAAAEPAAPSGPASARASASRALPTTSRPIAAHHASL